MAYKAPIIRAIQRAGRMIRVHTLVCEGCGAKVNITCCNNTGTLPYQIVHKKAGQKGWSTGKKPKCPDCQ